MAVVRTRSAPPYGAFVGFFLFGLAAVLAVIFYIMWAKAVDERDSAISGMNRAGTTAEMSAYQSANPADPTKHQSLLGQAKSTIDDLRTKLSEATAKGSDQAGDIASLTKSRDDANASAAAAEAARDEANKELQNARAGFAKEVASLNDQNDTLNKQVTAANADRDAAVQKGQEALNTMQADRDDQIKTKVLQIEQDKAELAQLNGQIRDLHKRIDQTGAHSANNVNVGTADSTVVRVNQGTGEAYILLGKNDRVVPGLTFTAYDPRLGVRYGSDEQAAGNGSMEVIEVGDTTSLCRITHVTPGKTIQAGDLIANPVFHTDRTRQFRFVVRGDFDLDGDGVATAAERDRIVRLIQGWGGRVDDKVTPQTDFIVVGQKPKNIATVETSDTATTGPAASEPQPGSIADQRQKEQGDYDDVVAEGKSLAIPVLNANRFLEMIGYYNTTIVRYDNNVIKKQ